MMEEKLIKQWIGVSQGLRGWFAVLFGEFSSGKYGYTEPILSSPTSYPTRTQAIQEAREWAEAENIPLEVDEIKDGE